MDGQTQLQKETRDIHILRFGAIYIRDLTVGRYQGC